VEWPAFAPARERIFNNENEYQYRREVLVQSEKGFKTYLETCGELSASAPLETFRPSFDEGGGEIHANQAAW